MMVASSVLCACVQGNAQQVLAAMLSGCENAVMLTVKLCAGYLLFCGLMAVAKEAGLQCSLERILRPVLSLLMPSIKEEKTHQAVAMNLSMNLLGMGNAATPMGIEAVRQMDKEARERPQVRHDLYMLLILNATSIQLLPTTILALRAAAGSQRIHAVVVPTLICTAVSTAAGAALGMLCRRGERKER